MKFTTVQEAFNHYRNSTIEQIEQRAAEIKGTIEKDPKADITSLNIEISGLEQAKANIQEKAAGGAGSAAERSAFNPITGMNFETRASAEATEGDVFSSVEYRSAFYKKLLGQELNTFEQAAFTRAQAETRADAFSSTTDTAAVIPTQTLNEVISKARDMGGILSISRSFNIPAKISIPVGTPTNKAAWNTEGAEVESEQPSIASVNFGSFEILKVFSISASVRRMSVPAFENYLAEELAACVMACLADGAVNGSGSGEGTGILNGITWTDGDNAVPYSGSGAPTYNDITSTIALLKRGYANGAKFVMNNSTLFTKVYGLVDGNKRPIFIQNAQTEAIGRILGFEVVIDDYLPDNEILFGNFQYMGYNLPEGIAVETSTQSSFKSGRIDYRAMAIADCKPIVEEAFVKLHA